MDSYELTMPQTYSDHDMRETAVYELAVRKLPAHRRVLVVAGLAQAVEYRRASEVLPKTLRELVDTGAEPHIRVRISDAVPRLVAATGD